MDELEGGVRDAGRVGVLDGRIRAVDVVADPDALAELEIVRFD